MTRRPQYRLPELWWVGLLAMIASAVIALGAIYFLAVWLLSMRDYIQSGLPL